MNWAEGLTDEQRNAAAHSGSHARLLAGPGTGKTLTITRRINRLLSSDVEPTSILALTFTRFAAGELRKRVKDQLGPGRKKLPRISTLHSYALRELLRNESRSRLPQPLRIADDWEYENIIVPEIQGLLGMPKKEARKLFFHLAADWQQLTADRDDWERIFPDPNFLGTWREHRAVYGYTLRSELVYQLKTSLAEGDLEVEGPPEHVLVDEYQDLNPCDLAVVRELASLDCEIYAAGDDDQSIYGFRQAEPEGIRRFPSEFTPSTELRLKVCKRCRKEILDLGLYVARQDPRRLGKPLVAESDERAEVRVLRFNDQGTEALEIGQLCQWLVKKKRVRPQEILILLRTDRQKVFSDPLRAALLSVAVPVNVASNPMGPLETDTGRELLSLLRLIVSPRDDLAWRSILQVRTNSLGATTFNAIYEVARREGVRFYDALDSIVKDPSSLGAKGSALKSERETILKKIRDYGPPPGEDVFSWLVSLIEKEIQDEQSRDDILELFGQVDKDSDATTLANLLRAATVSLGDKEQDLREDVASIMTMHQAKGLTARAVIVAAAEDEYIPGRATGKSIDDERRLLYVSLTRAKEFLFVTYCNSRTGRQRYTGRTSGQTTRLLTQFLSGGPIPVVKGENFESKLK